MSRFLFPFVPSANGFSFVRQIQYGGTAAATAGRALTNLGLVSQSEKMAPNGVTVKNDTGQLPRSVFPARAVPLNHLSQIHPQYVVSNARNGLVLLDDNGNLPDFLQGSAGPTIDGPTSIGISSYGEYEITDYDLNTTYVVSATVGSVYHEGNKIYYDAPSEEGLAGFVINDRQIHIEIIRTGPLTPQILSPENTSIDVSRSLVLSAASFSSSDPNDYHAYTNWQLAKDSEFVDIVSQVFYSYNNLIAYPVENLSPNTTYYARVQYGGWNAESLWSPVVSFTTVTSTLPESEIGKLNPLNRGDGDYFGLSLSVSSDGQTLLAGMPGRQTVDGQYVGAVAVFTRSGNDWIYQAELTPSHPIHPGSFGNSISVSGDGNTAVIGAHMEGVDRWTRYGGCYIFIRADNVWTESVYLQSPTPKHEDYYGCSVTISDDGQTMIVGAMGDDSPILDQGAAYCYQRTGNTWALTDTFTTNDPNVYDSFGSTVLLSGDGLTAFITAVGKTTNINQEGAVYVYKRLSGVWYFITLLTSPTVSDGARFGDRLASSYDGQFLVIGAYQHNGSYGNRQGAAFLFSQAGNNWSLTHEFSISSPASSDCLGRSVALSDDGALVVIGASSKTVKQIQEGSYSYPDQAGSAYLFTHDGTQWREGARIYGSDTGYTAGFGTAVVLTRDKKMVIVSAPNNSGQYYAQGDVYVFV